MVECQLSLGRDLSVLIWCSKTSKTTAKCLLLSGKTSPEEENLMVEAGELVLVDNFTCVSVCVSASNLLLLWITEITVSQLWEGLRPPTHGYPHSRLQTQARSIIQMSDEQNSQYVGMLYCVDLNMWPLCSSTCSQQQLKQSFPFYLPMSRRICIFYLVI